MTEDFADQLAPHVSEELNVTARVTLDSELEIRDGTLLSDVLIDPTLDTIAVLEEWFAASGVRQFERERL